MLLPSVAFILLWFLFIEQKKREFISFLVAIVILLIFQGSMMMRSQIATGDPSSQTSLGSLALMGAGPNATGTYMESGSGLICDISGLSAHDASNKMLSCASSWYLDNPVKGSVLLWKKSYYLWSPWYGPLSGGTSGRNPYLKFHPVMTSIESEKQFELVSGLPGKLVSWIWIIGGWFLMFYGFKNLFSSKNVEKIIGCASLVIILSSWMSLLVVHGDNRYRIAFMPLSLLLQLHGFQTLSKRISSNK
jgi:hypothetical protein